jgi:hypothetical protein
LPSRDLLLDLCWVRRAASGRLSDDWTKGKKHIIDGNGYRLDVTN